MARIQVQRVIDAPTDVVWTELSDIASHVEWMADAAAIRFTGDRHRGVGTTFDCVTKVGPLRTVDRMAVTSWVEGREIGVRHEGLVTGEGRFTLRREVQDQDELTVVAWSERLLFRWYVGGPVTAVLAKPVLRRIWQGNLRRLAARCAAAAS
jgi:carbon monoxide dehydrogenase subunit G